MSIKKLRLLSQQFAVVLFVSGCQSPSALGDRPIRSDAMVTAQENTATGRSPARELSASKEPVVIPTSADEVNEVCRYLTARLPASTAPAADAFSRDCKRDYQSALSARKLDCLRTAMSLAPAERAARIDSCTAGGQSFRSGLQNRKDFDAFHGATSLAHYSELGNRLLGSGDRLGLLGDVRARMNALCANLSSQHTTVSAWESEIELLKVAGEGQACASKSEQAGLAILEIRRQDQRDAYANARSWAAMAAFYETYKANDYANLLATAQVQLAALRQREIADMQSLSMPLLESASKDNTQWMPELKTLAKERLMRVSIDEKSFAGAARASRVSGDPSYTIGAQALARSTEDRKALEEFAMRHTALPGRFFKLSFSPSLGQGKTEEVRHQGIFADYTLHGHIPVSGTLSLQKSPTSPGPLLYGRYRVHVQLQLRLKYNYSRYSGVQGDADQVQDESIVKKLVVDISPPYSTQNVNVSFGEILASAMKRGSWGGVEFRTIAANPDVVATITKVEVL